MSVLDDLSDSEDEQEQPAAPVAQAAVSATAATVAKAQPEVASVAKQPQDVASALAVLDDLSESDDEEVSPAVCAVVIDRVRTSGNGKSDSNRSRKATR